MVNVKSVKACDVTVKTNIVFDEGYGWTNLKGLIEDAVSEYLLELRKAWADSTRLAVRISQIETRILGIEGIVDLGGTELNGSAENLIMEKDEIPVFGGVSA